MVDSIDNDDWERLDQLRERENLTTQKEIEDFLFTKETKYDGKIDLRKDHKITQVKDRTGKKRTREVKGLPSSKVSKIERFAEELIKPEKIREKISKSETVTQLRTRSKEISKIRNELSNRQNELKGLSQSLEKEIVVNKVQENISRFGSNIFSDTSLRVVKATVSPLGVNITSESARIIRDKIINNESISEEDIKY